MYFLGKDDEVGAEGGRGHAPPKVKQRLAIHRCLSVLVVVREVRKNLMSPVEIEEFIQDVEMLHNLNHPNIL